MNKDYEIQDDDKVFVIMPSGETIERTWSKSASRKLDITDVDPTIRKLVTRLNFEGFETAGSCAGHKDNGFISFHNRKASKEQIRAILKQYGISRIRFRDDGYYLYVMFPPQEPYKKVVIK